MLPRHILECLYKLFKRDPSISSNKIIEKLELLEPEDIELYIPQLVNTYLAYAHCVKKHENRLYSLITSLVNKSLIFAIRLYWYLTACHNEFKNSVKHELISKLRDLCQNMNRNNCKLKHKVTVFDNQVQFIETLVKLSEDLTKISEKSERKSVMVKKLHKLNAHYFTYNSTELLPVIKQYTNTNDVPESCHFELSSTFQRCLFPFVRSNMVARWIVNIAIDECILFNSKERAPVLLWVETIKDSTSVESNSNSSRGNSNESDIIEFNNLIESNSIDTKLLTKVFNLHDHTRKSRIKKQSMFSQLPGWDLEAFIIKGKEDMRQEELALQFIRTAQIYWEYEGITALTNPYTILATCPTGGIIELVSNSTSIDSVKKATDSQSINETFISICGNRLNPVFNYIQRNFIHSVAPYSVLCHLLQIKDRHNANIMISYTGKVVHIDYGFLLTISPGKLNFETAPFKLSSEMADIIGDFNSKEMKYFTLLFYECYQSIRRNSDVFLYIIQLLKHQSLPCLGSDSLTAIQQLKQRMKLNLTNAGLALYVKEIIAMSVNNWRTKKYDQFQKIQNGII